MVFELNFLITSDAFYLLKTSSEASWNFYISFFEHLKN